MVGKFTATKTGDMLVTFSLPEFNLKKQISSSWAFHVDERYDVIIGIPPRSTWRIGHNHDLQ
jgi:hypothetical protein